MNKHWKYLCYVIKHKWFVMMACFARGLYWQGIVHDLSKFRPSEWGPYAEYFYGEKKTDQEITEHNRRAWMVVGSFAYSNKYKQDRFDEAWLFHQHRNPHHWQHWILRQDDGEVKVLEMPEKYALEMLCDWEGAGLAITGTKEYDQWYLRNKDSIQLHPKTRDLIERRMFPLVNENEKVLH